MTASRMTILAVQGPGGTTGQIRAFKITNTLAAPGFAAHAVPGTLPDPYFIAAINEPHSVVTAGLYDAQTSTFYFKSAAGQPSIVVTYSSAQPNWIPVVGDWTGSGTTTVGLYDPTNAVFHLLTSNTTNSPTIDVAFGVPGSNSIPLAGDWTGSGATTIGLYNPATSTFSQRDTNTSGDPRRILQFRPAGQQLDSAGQQLDAGGGQFDRQRHDHDRLVRPATSTFYERDTNTSGSPRRILQVRPGGQQLDAGGGRLGPAAASDIGLLDPVTSFFYERNSNAAGLPDNAFQYGACSSGVAVGAGDRQLVYARPAGWPPKWVLPSKQRALPFPFLRAASSRL